MSLMSVMSLAWLILATSMVSGHTEAILGNIPVEGRLDFTGLVEWFGYRAVAHEIRTKDGYILTMFNIPGDRTRPVLLAHGLFDSSDGFIIRGNRSLALMAAEKGYDVWAMNARGNRYSRNHTSLDPDTDPEFWDYSAHEYGTSDLPACIDYVLAATKQKRLSLFGFSEGTTAAFILGASKPEYNEKIKVFIALAPVVFLENTRPALSYIIEWSSVLDSILPASVQEVAGYNSAAKAVINVLCTQLPFSYELCYNGGFNSVSGPDPYGIEREFFPVVVGHFPAGTSRKNLIHFAQVGLKKRFAQYDYGPAKNLNIYRAFSPPEYDLSKFTMRTVLVSGMNDPVSTLEDVEILKTKIHNVEKHIIIDNPLHNHLDHLWAQDVHIVEYDQLFVLLARHR